MEPDEFDAVVAAVRAFVREQVVPRENEIEEKDEIPADLRDKAAAMGLFGYALPQEYGGLGLSMTQDVRLSLEIGYTTPSFRSMFSINNGVAGQLLAGTGTEEQKRRYLPRMASGELIAAFTLTEAEAGSDPSGIRTRAVRDGDVYVLNGSKRFITNAPLAGVFIVFARTGPQSTGPGGISVFAVDADTPGVTVGPPDHKMGQSGALSAEVFFDDVRVPASALVGEREEEGFHVAMRSLARGRLSVAAMCVGLARRMLDESVAHASVSRQGGRPIGEYQLVQAMLAESHAELYAARAMVLEAARAYDSGEDRRLAPSSAKLFCSEMAGRVADRAVQIHGGMGYMRHVPVERFYRDVRLFRIYEGTSEIQKLIIGRQLLREHR
ncbi:acyl-CoA dehydrogenase [Streptomyces himastatinicus ATCC 53653]|uniref:Acyl-CoA dehydrogenase n=1 Tax=Streptomyces himastatinicus ATCC 53653 TaxID=457427 RepID=D9WJ05_9ACTN|nr:acyl-CoA dehydrogenase family protein [Streptomyces himastatinicus]EFL27658.1 acyl-CoA dehydrogenase [Streptomyces himastatinicus ATCC 53653]